MISTGVFYSLCDRCSPSLLQILPDYLGNLFKLRSLFYVCTFNSKLRQITLEVELDNKRTSCLSLADYLQVPAGDMAPSTHSVLVFRHQVLVLLVGKCNDGDVTVRMLNKD